MNEDVTMPDVPLGGRRAARHARATRGTPFGWTIYALAVGAVMALAIVLALR
jgi:hypothetical protein